MKKGIVYPRLWLRHLRVRRALIGYPLYDVPHKFREADLSEAEVQANFEYFMRARLDRLAVFQRWLRDNFRVDASLSPNGVLAVNRWVNDFGGGVCGDEPDRYEIFATYEPTWTGELAGFNLMIDLGIFMGEYVIWRRPKVQWAIYRGHEIEPETLGSIGYLRPTLVLPRLWRHDALASGFGIIVDRRNASKIGHSIISHPPNRLVGTIRQDLYLSGLPDHVVVIGDSSHEPL